MANKSALYLVYLLLFIAVAQSSLAITVIYGTDGNISSGPEGIVDAGIVFIGSAFQDRVDNVEADIKIKNTGNEIIIITSLEDSVSSQFDFEVITSTPITINPGSQVTVRLKADFPLDFDAIDSNGRVNSKNVGLIKYLGTVGSDNLILETPVLMQAKNNLIPEKVRVYVNGKLFSPEDGDTISGVSPGDSITVEVEVRNDFGLVDEASEGEDTIADITIEEIEFEVEIDDDDFDINEREELSDLKPEREDEETIEFDIDSDVPNAGLIMRIQVEGEDENNAKHGFRYDVVLQIKKQNHDLSFQDIKINPRTVQCERDVKFRFTLANIGKSSETAGKVVLESSSLNVFEEITNISIRRGKFKDYEFNVKIEPDVTPGTYIFNLKSFYRHKYQIAQRNIDMEILDCEGLTTETPDEELNVLPPPKVVTIEPEEEQQEEIAENETKEPSIFSEFYENNKRDVIWLFSALGLLIVIMVILIILFVKSK